MSGRLLVGAAIAAVTVVAVLVLWSAFGGGPRYAPDQAPAEDIDRLTRWAEAFRTAMTAEDRAERLEASYDASVAAEDRRRWNPVILANLVQAASAEPASVQVYRGDVLRVTWPLMSKHESRPLLFRREGDELRLLGPLP